MKFVIAVAVMLLTPLMAEANDYYRCAQRFNAANQCRLSDFCHGPCTKRDLQAQSRCVARVQAQIHRMCGRPPRHKPRRVAPR